MNKIEKLIKAMCITAAVGSMTGCVVPEGAVYTTPAVVSPAYTPVVTPAPVIVAPAPAWGWGHWGHWGHGPYHGGPHHR